MPNGALVNFAAGETSPRSRGRFDLDWFRASAEKILNFIPEVTGPARYRSGFKFVRQTRGGAVARLIPFPISNSQSYMLEFTAGYMRAYKNGDLVKTSRTTITAATKASPCVITVASTTGLANGDEIIITGAEGMFELNNRQVKLANKSGSTYELVDPVTGANINSTSFGTWSSGGTVYEVYEITTPYQAVDLANIQVANDGALMYLTNPKYVPYKLTVDVYDAFTLTTYSRTNDPFTAAASAATMTDLRPVFVGDRRKKVASTLTPGATTGNGINFAASNPLTFTSADVGKYLRAEGAGRYGRAIITAFVDTQNVTAVIQVDFDSTVALASGEWEIVTVETMITLAANSVINGTLTYTISGVSGATQVNGNTYILLPYDVPGSPTRYLLRTTSGNSPIDSTGWGTYSADGTATPTANQPSLTITGITRGTATSITFAGGSNVQDNVLYTFSAVVGTVEINGGTYYLQSTAGVVYLKTSAGADVDSSGWTAYSSGGLATVGAECPLAVAFYEGRLIFAGTNQRPAVLFLSRAPDDDGNARYDDFTGGVDADHACFFQLAPVNGIPVSISWARGTSKYLFVGTFSGPFRVSGSGLDEPITPDSINTRQFDTFGCEAVTPAGGTRVFWVQRGGTALRTSRYDANNDDLVSYDMLLNAEHIAYSRLQRVIIQIGRPDSLWVPREDGILAGVTVQGQENVAGWHRHRIGGTSTKVLDAQPLPRTDKNDQLWIVSERVISSTTRRFVEIMADDAVFLDRHDFYTDADSEATDETAWRNSTYRRQEEYVHLDAAGTYNGSDRPVAAGATLTAGTGYGTVGSSVTFVASAAVFKSTDVGKELWFKPHRDTGVGGGRATITAYTNSTHVTATITVAFTTSAAIPAADWYFAVGTIYVPHLDGAAVSVVTDGAPADDTTVATGQIALSNPAAVVHVGLSYAGFIKSHNLELAGAGGNGPAQSKPRVISEAYIRFLNTLGVDFGTNLYDLEQVEWRNAKDLLDRPAPVFSGIRRVPIRDRSEGEEGKHLIISQRLPLPCVAQFVDVRYDTTESA